MENNRFSREISLCLSGGAAKGAYHLGAIDVLEKNSINIKAISGVSIGAIIGASIASGNSAQDTFKILKSKEFRKMFQLNIGKGSIFKVKRDEEVLDKLVKVKTFEELSIPLYVAVTDIKNSKAIYFESGELVEILFASSAITPLLEPVELEGNIFVDGGLIDNFPIEVLEKYNYPILGINLYPNDKQCPKTIYTWLKKTIYLAWQQNNWSKEEKCDYYLTNDKLVEISTIGFKDLDKAYTLGQEDMQNYLNNQ